MVLVSSLSFKLVLTLQLGTFQGLEQGNAYDSHVWCCK